MKGPRRIKLSTKANARRLRGGMTDAERLLWRQLRHKQVAGLKFRRQHPLGSFICDFVCIEAALVIEVDGGQHAERRDSDEARTAWLNNQGYRVLRFWNNEILDDIEAVGDAIWDAVHQGRSQLPDPLPPPGQGGG
jgi:very-short-patch-repair endonuclease